MYLLHTFPRFACFFLTATLSAFKNYISLTSRFNVMWVLVRGLWLFTNKWPGVREGYFETIYLKEVLTRSYNATDYHMQGYSRTTKNLRPHKHMFRYGYEHHWAPWFWRNAQIFEISNTNQILNFSYSHLTQKFNLRQHFNIRLHFWVHIFSVKSWLKCVSDYWCAPVLSSCL